MSEGNWQPITRAEAVELGWHDADDGCGTVTRAWDEWYFNDRDQRAWMHLTLSSVQARYDDEWSKIQREPGDADGPDPVEVLVARTWGLAPHEHEWMTLASTIRDAVSAYEIYMSKAVDEVLRHHRKARKGSDRTLGWSHLRRWCEVLGVNPSPGGVLELTELRNVLTHQRGELRTAADRERFADRQGIWGEAIAHLTGDRVTGYLDELGDATRAADPVFWAYSWGGARLPTSC